MFKVSIGVRGVRSIICQRQLSTVRPHYGLFINGREHLPIGGDKFTVENPATATPLCTVSSSSNEDVAHAINVAQDTFQSGVWSRMDVRDRSKILFKIAADLRANLPHFAKLEVAQTGRAIREMNAQLGRLPEWFEYFGSLIRTHEGTCPPFLGNYVNYVKRVPLGVCGLLSSFNHPLLIAIKKIAPAIAAGNTVVLKPSELAPISCLEFAAMCTESGLPNGVLNVLPGFGPATGKAICSHPHIRKVDLTGGTNTGRAVGEAAGRNLAQVATELGGKAPMIIFDDADLTQAVNGAAFATFVASGQTCIMGARLLIHHKIYDKFVQQIAVKAARIPMGDPTLTSTMMGPVISRASRNRIAGMVDAARAAGATVITGGCVPDLPSPFNQGHYYAPTVIEVDPSMEIWREEVFGPVVVAVPFQDEEEAIKLANDSPYGLAAAVWTNDVKRAHRVADKLDVGIVWINDHHRNDPASPWGGMKNSGVGRENGLSALLEYSQTRSVVVRMDDAPFDWFEQSTTRYS